MKTRTITIASIAVLWLAAGTVSAVAATSQDKKAAEDQAKKEDCFRAHGKLMSKPALTNIYDCWRAHGYLMTR
jgi:hypothetical protein